MMTQAIASMTSVDRARPAGPGGDVVEIGLLLPSGRADDLLRLARDRRISVGHLLRTMIDRELATPA